MSWADAGPTRVRDVQLVGVMVTAPRSSLGSGLLVLVALALAMAAGTGCDRSTREDRQEAAVTAASVENELARHGVNGVEVTLANGVAVLTGMVANEGESARADRVARDVAGVRSVDNRLSVEQPPALTSATDHARTAALIESRLAAIGVRGVRVLFEEGGVVVKGQVSRAQHDEAMRIVLAETPHGYRLVDRLDVQ